MGLCCTGGRKGNLEEWWGCRKEQGGVAKVARGFPPYSFYFSPFAFFYLVISLFFTKIRYAKTTQYTQKHRGDDGGAPEATSATQGGWNGPGSDWDPTAGSSSREQWVPSLSGPVGSGTNAEARPFVVPGTDADDGADNSGGAIGIGIGGGSGENVWK